MARDPVDVSLRAILHGFRHALRELRGLLKNDDPRIARIETIIRNTKHDGDAPMPNLEGYTVFSRTISEPGAIMISFDPYLPRSATVQTSGPVGIIWTRPSGIKLHVEPGPIVVSVVGFTAADFATRRITRSWPSDLPGVFASDAPKALHGEGAPTKTDILSAFRIIGVLVAHARNMLPDGILANQLGEALYQISDMKTRVEKAEEATDNPRSETYAATLFGLFKQSAVGHFRADVIAASLRMMEYAHHHNKAPMSRAATEAFGAADVVIKDGAVIKDRDGVMSRQRDIGESLRGNSVTSDKIAQQPELDAELSEMFKRDSRALAAAQEIENIFARGHTGGTTQRLAAIQGIVTDAMDTMCRPLTPQEDAARYERPPEDPAGFVSLSQRLAGLHGRGLTWIKQRDRLADLAAAATGYEEQLKKIVWALGVNSIREDMILPRISFLNERSALVDGLEERVKVLERNNHDLEAQRSGLVRQRDGLLQMRDDVLNRVREPYM